MDTNTPDHKAVKALIKNASKPVKKGVVFLSRLPPFMNPTSLRKLLEAQFDCVERIYLEREK